MYIKAEIINKKNSRTNSFSRGSRKGISWKIISKMTFEIGATSLLKEVCISLITLSVYLFVGVGRSYMVFLFHQLDLPGSKIPLDDEQQSWIASSLGILSPFGCIFSGFLMDHLGRKLYFFIIFIPQIISWTMIGFATTYELLLCGMIIQGLNLGMGFTCSTYMAEIASPQRRGALLGLIPIAYNSGAMLCNMTMYFVRWNIAAFIYVALSVFFMMLMLLLPESPMWLYSKGEKEKSVQILCSLRCTNIDGIKNEIEDMEKSNVGKCNTSFTRLIEKISGAWKPLLITVLLQVFTQNSGFMIIFGYTILIFDKLNLPLSGSEFAVIYSITGVFGAMAAPFSMHRIKRKVLLAVASFIMASSIITVGVYEEIFYHQSEKPYPYIIPVAFYLYVMACNAGVTLIGFSIGGEIFPNEVRGIMNGIYGAFFYIYWSTTMKLYPTFMHVIHIKTLIWGFAGFCMMSALFGIFVLPETKGLTLNEVQEKYFQKRKKPDEQVA